MARGSLKGLTVNIGGNTTDLQSALRDVEKNANATKRSLSDIKYALKLNPSDKTLQESYTKTLQTQIDNTKKKLELLKEADKNAKQQLADGTITEQAYANLQKEISLTTKSLDRLENELKDSGDLFAKNHAELKKFGEAMETAGKKVQEFGAKAKNIGDNMSKYVTVPITALATAAYAAWKEYDEAIDGIATATGAAGDQMEDFENVYRRVMSNLPFESQNVSAAIGELNTQFGFTGEELEKATISMGKFAEITGADVVRSTQGAKKAMSLYNIEAENLDQVLDAVAKVSQDTGVATDRLFDTVVRGAPSLKKLNISFEESVVLVGKLEKAGIDSSRSLSYLTRAQAQFAKEGKDLNSGLRELSERIKESSSETEKLNLAAEYFGTKGGAVMLEAIESGALSLDDLAESASSASGTVARTFDEILDPADEFQVTMNNLKLILADLGGELQKALGPAMKWISESLRDLTDWFSKLDDDTKAMIVNAGLLTAAAGPVISVSGRVAEGIGKIVANVGGLAKEMAGAPAEMGGFAKFLKNLGSPAGLAFLAVGAIAALTTSIIALVNESSKHLNKINDISKKTEESFSAYEGKSRYISSLVDELNKLNSVQDKSYDQQQRIKYILSQLNTLLPEHSLEWDEASKSVKGLNDEFLNFVNNAKREAVFKIQSEAIEEFTKQLVEAEGKIYDAEMKYQKSIENIGNVTTEQSTKMLESLKNGMNWFDILKLEEFEGVNRDWLRKLYNAGVEFNNERNKMAEVQDEANKRIEETNERTSEVIKRISGETTDTVKGNIESEQQAKDEAQAKDEERLAQEEARLAERNAKVEEAAKQYEASYKSHRDSLNAVQAEGYSKSEVTLDQYLQSMRTRQEQQQAFDENMNRLKVKLIESGNADMLANLSNFNIEHAQLVQELADGDESKLKELIDIWETNSQIAGKSASTELERELAAFGPIMDDVLAKLEEENPEFAAKAKGWMSNVKQEIERNKTAPADAVRDSNKQTKQALSEISDTADTEGSKINQKTAEGISRESAAAKATESMNKDVQDVYAQIAKDANIAGKKIPLQITMGINDNRHVPINASKGLVSAVQREVSKISNGASQNGAYVALGVESGIRNNAWRAYNAGSALAAQVNLGFRRTLDINSPSGVMEENIDYVADGIEISGKKNKRRIDKVGRDLANSLNAGFNRDLQTDYDKNLNLMNSSRGNMSIELGEVSVAGLKDAISTSSIDYAKLANEFAKALTGVKMTANTRELGEITTDSFRHQAIAKGGVS